MPVFPHIIIMILVMMTMMVTVIKPFELHITEIWIDYRHRKGTG